MIYWISMYNGLKINQALFELMREIRRFSPNFDVFRPKNGDLWPFDAEKSLSYKPFYSVTTNFLIFPDLYPLLLSFIEMKGCVITDEF